MNIENKTEIKKVETRGRKKGQTYKRNKPLYNVYIKLKPTKRIHIGKFSSYKAISEAIDINRDTCQNIALGRIKHKHNNIIIERIKV